MEFGWIKEVFTSEFTKDFLHLHNTVESPQIRRMLGECIPCIKHEIQPRV